MSSFALISESKLLHAKSNTIYLYQQAYCSYYSPLYLSIIRFNIVHSNNSHMILYIFKNSISILSKCHLILLLRRFYVDSQLLVTFLQQLQAINLQRRPFRLLLAAEIAEVTQHHAKRPPENSSSTIVAEKWAIEMFDSS